MASARTTADQRGQAALRALEYDWRAFGYRIVFRPYTGATSGREPAAGGRPTDARRGLTPQAV